VKEKFFLVLAVWLAAASMAQANEQYNPTGFSVSTGFSVPTGPSVGPGAYLYPPASTSPPPRQVYRPPVQQHWVDPDYCPPGTVAPVRRYGYSQPMMRPMPPRPMVRPAPHYGYRPPVMAPPRPPFHQPMHMHRMQPHSYRR
jgi:hypothetical protein